MLIPVILSGGFGSRLWPLSRKTKPKHFMPLIDSDLSDSSDKSLLQQTISRCYNNNSDTHYISPFTHSPVLVCDEVHRFLVAEQCEEIGIKPDSILLEPERKDTAAAIILALFYIVDRYPNANVVVLPSDHFMSDNKYYLERISNAVEFINMNKIITFGITPNYPETGYGYIHADYNNKLSNKAYSVNKFIEKPDYTTAIKLLESGEYLWNSGIFMFNAAYLLSMCEKLQPELYNYCKLTAYSSTRTKNSDFVFFDKHDYAKIEPISIDYALMQDADDMVVLQYDGQWSDVGCWRGVWENSPKDIGNNVVKGNVINEDTKNCYLRSDSRLIVTIGVDNLSVIETPDAVLVTKLENSKDLRGLVEQYISTQAKEFVEHSHVHRPWGEFIVINDGKGYKVKKLIVKPEASLSLQSHEHRDEHWVIVTGQAEIKLDDETRLLTANDPVHIPVGVKHRVTNVSSDDYLIIIEVQVGDYLGEDDIIRYHDIYGRIRDDKKVVSVDQDKGNNLNI